MTPTIRNYLNTRIHEGERNRQLYLTLCQCRDNGVDPEPVVTKAIQTDGLPEREARAVANSIYGRDAREPSHVRAGNGRAPSPGPLTYTYNGVRAPVAAPVEPAASAVPAGAYDTSDSGPLPDPISDPTITFLRSAFEEGDMVSLATEIYTDDGNNIPDGRGITFERNQLIRIIQERGHGDPSEVWDGSRTGGVFVRINAMMRDGDSDKEVARFRYALLEWDHIPVEQQWALIQKSEIPCAAVIHSGGNSLHAWVKVDAEDIWEFQKRVLILHDHFRDYDPDAANKNPSRFSRLPGALRRGYPDRTQGRRQDLLALDMGAENWDEWLEILSYATLPQPLSTEALLNMDPSVDPNQLLGLRRWICRGFGVLLIGASGIGKSSFIMQAAVCFALQISLFGIPVAFPLKVLVIQSENDSYDLAEQLQGVVEGMGLNSQQKAQLTERLIVVPDSTSSGANFIQIAERQIRRHEPDIVIADPLASYIGGDLSRQDVVAEFLRNGLNDVMERTNTAWIWVHHTGKPLRGLDKKADGNRNLGDFSYLGLGSSDLTNWARAIITLIEVGAHDANTRDEDRRFELILSKRGERAGMRDINGVVSQRIFLKHSAGGRISWELAEPPIETRSRPNVRLRDSNSYQIAEANFQATADDLLARYERHINDGTNESVAVFLCAEEYRTENPELTCAHILDRMGLAIGRVTIRIEHLARYLTTQRERTLEDAVRYSTEQWGAASHMATRVINRIGVSEEQQGD